MNIRKREDSFTSKKNNKIFYRVWSPSEKPSATVVFCHGIGEHSGRYEHVGNFFAKEGLAFYALDHQGHGKSEGARGHMTSYEGLLQDVDQLADIALNETGTKSFFIYGHSLGGQIALAYALLYFQRPLAGVLVTGPWIKLPFLPPLWKRAVGNLMSKILPALAVTNELDLVGLSRDAEIISAYKNDPLVHDQITTRTYKEGTEMAERLLKAASTMSLPMLLMHAGQDRLTSPEGTQQFFQRAGSKDKTLKIYEESFHELHNDLNKNIVIAESIAWVKAHSTQQREGT
jgi:acylglycerol lipase